MEYEKRGVRYSCGRGRELVDWAHVHPEFEIVYNVESDCVAICDGVEYTVNAGDLFIAFPHQVHSYRYSPDLVHQLLVFSAEDFLGFAEIFKTKKPRCPVIRDCGETIRFLIDQIAMIDKNSEYGEQKMFGYITVLLGEIFPRLELCDRQRSDMDSVKRLLEYCSLNYMKDISLERLSRDLYMNKFHISHMFNDTLGISLREYINLLRLNQAERLLRKDELSIGEIASVVGFSTQRTFNRVFLEQKGVTPSQYRQQNIKKKR